MVRARRREHDVLEGHDEVGPPRPPVGAAGPHLRLPVHGERRLGPLAHQLNLELESPAVAGIPLEGHHQHHLVLLRGEPGGGQVVERPVDVQLPVGPQLGVLAERHHEDPRLIDETGGLHGVLHSTLESAVARPAASFDGQDFILTCSIKPPH